MENRDYYVKHNKDVNNQDVKIYCSTFFSELKFLGKYKKTHFVRGLGDHYHTCFDTKLGNGTYEIRCIPSDFTLCTYSIDQPWIPDFSNTEITVLLTHQILYILAYVK